MTGPRKAEDGVVLINVLVILALMATVVFAMISISDISVARSQRYSEASQALELIAAGETSAIVVLRRDMSESPDSDHLLEDWAQIQQDEVAIEGGRFSLTITDAQAKLNLNSLQGGGAGSLQLLSRTIATLGLPPDLSFRIAARLTQTDLLLNLSDLETSVGLTSAEVARLSELVTVLPRRTDININTAPDELMNVIANNPVQARNLIGIRNRQGFLTRQDVIAAGMLLPPGIGFSSQFFFVATDVVIGATQQSQQSLLQRRVGPGSQPEVVVVGR